MHRSRLLSLVALLTAAFLAACSASPGPAAPSPTPATGKQTIIIGYSAPGLVGAQLDIQQSLERHAKERGWQIITTTSGGDAQKQNSQIENFIGLGIDAIVAVPDDSAGICTAAESARKAGIPFYTIDRSPSGCTINMTVLSDNYMAGKQSGEALVELLTQRYGTAKGKVLEITGNMSQNVAQLRGQGFQDVLKGSPQIELITKQGDWDTEKGEAIVREALAAHADLDAIYMQSDAVYFPGTLRTLGEAGRLYKRGEAGHIFLAGVDGSPTGVQAVKDGFADQVSNQPIPDFGIVVDWIAKELSGEKIVEGEVLKEGALWSPARVKMSDVGPQLFLATTSVTEKNMDNPGLWANQ